ncbi:MAG: hypothetical protein QMC79_01185 [Anaerosomatales bacterium]|nr:hypothetical protein [Anaerosomatales bacterium]
MSEEHRSGADDASERATPAPLPVTDLPPVPAPVEVPVRRRPRWPWIVGIIAVVVIIAGCVGSYYLVDSLLGDEASFDDPVIPVSFGGPGGESIVWSGNGRYAVIQHYEDFDIPVVVVWDRETDEVRTERGYVLVAAETFGAQVWLEPRSDVVDWVDGIADIADHRPERLLVWRLDVPGATPTDDAPAKWRAWPGPGDRVAYLEVDPLKGAAPAKVLINNAASSGEGVKAELPDDVGTFLPVGWSPSGRYFALEELADLTGTSWTDPDADPLGEASPGERSPRRLLVVDAETGALVGDSPLDEAVDHAPASVWAADEDTLYTVASSLWDPETGDDLPAQVWRVEPGEEPVDAFAAEGWERRGRLDAAYFLRFIGWSPEGPLLLSDEALWRLGADGPDRLGGAYWTGAAWAQDAGLVAITQEWDSATDTDRLVASFQEGIGAPIRVIWEGPPIDGEVGMSFD